LFDADPDIPILKRAKAEYAKLQWRVLKRFLFLPIFAFAHAKKRN
jgi:hypothetical protein